jgi:nitroreductase
MELEQALRTTAAIRDVTDEAVSDEVLWRILDTARFAPSGGNGQGWHVVVVQDPALRRGVRDLYLPGWYEYLAMSAAGLRPWSPLNDPDAEAAALPAAAGIAGAAAAAPGFAEHLDQVPVLLALFVDLGVVAAVDRDSDRYSFCGGASVYPFAWNLMVAARGEGLGGVMTTMCIRHEDEVKALLGAPDSHALAAVIVLGHPVHQPTRLNRAPVEQFATVDSVAGPAFTAG